MELELIVQCEKVKLTKSETENRHSPMMTAWMRIWTTTWKKIPSIEGNAIYTAVWMK